MPATVNPLGARWDLNVAGGGAGTLTLGGRLDAGSTTSLWKELEARLRQTPVSALEVNAAGVDYCDGAGLALLHFLSMGRMGGPGAKVTMSGLRPEFLKLFEKFTAQDYEKNRPTPPQHKAVVE